jgi:hypothetical protein
MFGLDLSLVGCRELGWVLSLVLTFLHGLIYLGLFSPAACLQWTTHANEEASYECAFEYPLVGKYRVSHNLVFCSHCL